ncbi:MAG: type VI secretion system ATPase TssH [Planctomycetes bacterium]|nr:type VI secretion system ATPase TssH [Planctomycetota bacterium]
MGRQSAESRRALEGAAGLCLSRSHYNVEIEHWLLKILETPGSAMEAALRRFEIDVAQIARDLNKCLERLKTGNSRPPALAPSIVDLAREGWLVASLDFEAGEASSGHLLIALLSNDTLARQAREISPLFDKVVVETLRKEFPSIAANASESQRAAAPAGGASSDARPRGSGKTPNLDQFTVDLTERARAGAVDPVLGRDDEIRQVIDILTRRRQNNPILTGEPGVGKTAVAEGFALKVAQGEVPPALKNVAVRTLDLALLQAGAGVKGEFENRLKGVIEEVKASATPIILFIDEAHTMIGAGGAAGQGDAANLLKPALARGELRTIAATTWAEYKKYFERDAALARRFQVVKVEEPSEAVAIEIMRGLAKVMEKHHGVRVLDEALQESVRLSMRYLAGRQLPDKSVSLLDTACARVALSQAATPAALEDCRTQLARLDTEERALQREHAVQARHGERLAEIAKEKAAAQERLAGLEKRWTEEKRLVGELMVARAALEADALARMDVAAAAKGAAPAGLLPDADRDAKRAMLDRLEHELQALQGDAPLIHPHVRAQAIAEVISNWTGIPVGRMLADQIRSVLELKDRLEKRVVGQSHALDIIARNIRISRANLKDPQRPIGVFMLAGPSGVGKTETAIALAEELYGGEQNMTVINMSEFKEEHKVSLLMGSPPGYVGYGEGGVLTEAVRRRPYSVVLLDELEKAHPGVQEIFYQVFDKGTLKDGEGRDIDFRNTVIIMTTNAGTDAVMSLCADPETRPDADAFASALHPELLKTFKPAFLGRCQVLPYYPLTDDVKRGIIELKLKKIAKRIAASYQATFTWSKEFVEGVLARCTEVESGARNVDHILSRTLLPELAAEFLARLADGQTIRTAHATLAPEGHFRYELG